MVEPVPWLSLWTHGPWRWWNTVTRNRSWWATVRGPQMAFPLVREQAGSHEQAVARAQVVRGELAAAVIGGSRVAGRGSASEQTDAVAASNLWTKAVR